MGVPRAHSTRAQKGKRRSHLKMQTMALSLCGHCTKPTLPHTVCKYCGFYEGKEIVNVLALELKKKDKKTKKQA